MEDSYEKKRTYTLAEVILWHLVGVYAGMGLVGLVVWLLRMSVEGSL